jgi:ELWxxDGT repeat protein
MNKLCNPLPVKEILTGLLVLVVMVQNSQAQFRLVADLDPASAELYDNPKNFDLHSSDGIVSYFAGDKNELWTSNGTTEGTRLIKRLLLIGDLQVIGGLSYLNVLSDDLGAELWRSDGLGGSTIPIKDIYPGRGSSNPLYLTKMNGVLYFSANNNTNGRELWRSEGNSSNTQLVKDIVPGSGASLPSRLTVSGNRLFFTARTESAGTELWSSDGTAAGTFMVRDINPGAVSSDPFDLVAVNGWVYFTATSPNGGRQLWKSNGTAGGTSIVKIINPGGNAKLSKLINVNGQVFFQANDGVHGVELWRSDGTSAGTYMVKDLTPGPGSNATYAEEHLNDFASINGKLFFTALALNTSSNIWMSDGTAAGTRQITFYPEDPNLRVTYPSFYEINGAAYFAGITPDNGVHLSKIDMDGRISLVRRNIAINGNLKLRFATISGKHFFIGEDHYWRTDGTTAGTFQVRTVGFPGGSMPSDLTNANGSLYFRTYGPNGLWKTNGTPGSTIKVMDDPDIDIMGGSNSNLLFMSGRFNGTASIWRTDGTPAGTFKLSQLASNGEYFTPLNNLVYFNAYSYTGSELWKSDGTVGGTGVVRDIVSGAGSSDPRQLLPVGTNLYFTAETTANGRELWRTNGFPEQTYQVKDILPGSESSNISNLTSFKGKLFFTAKDAIHGYELWQSNGSNTFTSMVRDIRSGDELQDVSGVTATNDWLFFFALNQNDRIGLWKSDGTSAGTVEIRTLESSDFPAVLAPTDSQVFFILSYSGYIELWRTNGVSTVRLATFRSQFLHSNESVAVKGNTVYFITGSEATFLWRSDGTYAGTYGIPFQGRPERLRTSGNYVYLSGQAQKEGYELFIIEEATSMTSEEVVDVVMPATDTAEVLTSYPNPFNSTMHLKVSGKEGEAFELSVTGTNGTGTLTENDLPCNVVHEIGSLWSSGVYILQVKKGDRIVSKRVIKLQD